MPHRRGHVPDWLFYGFAVGIALLWATSMVLDMLRQSYDPPASVHMVMAMASAAVFGVGVLRGGNGGR